MDSWRPVRFSAGDEHPNEPYNYGNNWQRESFPDWSRLVIGPSDNHINVVLNLAKVMPPPYFILWVLVSSASGREPGRYQSPPMGFEELTRLVSEYRDFFECDGRHHLWVGTTSNRGQIIHDNHNLIYAYGPLDDFEGVISDLGFHEAELSIPYPHTWISAGEC